MREIVLVGDDNGRNKSKICSSKRCSLQIDSIRIMGQYLKKTGEF